ncbi:acyltransferase [Mycolicibacterium monacense DSM 44395]|uniref:Acyltransferase n=1 Tax=Mycolicibacterium monacense TaxID=85693 RepID=A0AAD1MY33_MYCMB|nr:acyltransferase [Mycolicibacterium monacense]MDA4104181.1 acyltransferase [Mycolicibacterium monacense DSM 44395]OBF47074.1 acyltransferase [Mycolicibacterium monacense]ORB15961.1 acyltransferase [Mycolicibacterium monacense DSM 44395]QHP85047.1 acyltransferase [Mycolicibacterium monacense DSM 44395]BBZ62123.1 acyltransferase [Mycolicibacterium monacense]
MLPQSAPAADAGPVAAPADRVASLTGLRGIAALLVVGTHAAFATGKLPHGYLGTVYARLDIGVAIFFVLSGFLLFRPWVRAAATGMPGPSVDRYARRRARRILPAYLVTVLLAYLVFALWTVEETPGQSWAGLARHLTLTQIYTGDYLFTYLHHGLSQTWSLAVEVSFYVALPLLAYLLWVVWCRRTWRPVRLLGGLVAMAAVSPVWLTVVHTTEWLPNSAGMWLPAHLDWFAGGMALATLQRMGVRCRAAVAIPLAILLFLVVSTPVAGEMTMGPMPLWAPLMKNLLYACIATLAVAPLALGAPARTGGWYRRALSCRPVAWLGEVSYELFLLHVLVMAVLIHALDWPLFGGSLAGLFALTLLFAVPSAWALNRLTWRPADNSPDLRCFGTSAGENPVETQRY